MTDDQILKALGLSDEELRELLARTDTFVRQLIPRERKVVNGSLPTASEAAKTFGDDLTPAQLTKFLNARLPANPVITGVLSAVRSPKK